MYNSAAQEPTEPKNLKINYFVQSVRSDSEVFHTLSIGWDAPDNIGKFDLEYYIVQSVMDSGLIINGTTTEHVYLFDFNELVEGSVSIKVTAVSKCSQYSQTASTVVDTVTRAAELDIHRIPFSNSKGEN